MSVSNVGGSQQTGAPTFDVKEQNQGPLSQRRTPDTLGGKNASSSCSFRYCFTRIYDFFCALFRCLFCIKNKPKEPNTEEDEQTGKSAQNQSIPNTAKVSRSELEQTQPDREPNTQTSVKQDSIKPANADSTTAQMVSKAITDAADFQSGKDAPEPKTSENSLDSIYVLPKQPERDPHEESVAFIKPFREMKGIRTISRAFIEARGRFKDKPPKVQDEILQNLLGNNLYHVLVIYLGEECLGKERNQAFLAAYGAEMFSADEAHKFSQDKANKSSQDKAQELRQKLRRIFQGFGCTLPAAPVA